MLPKLQIKEHAKYAVYTHLFSCFLIVIVASLMPMIVSGVTLGRVLNEVDFAAADFNAAAFLKDYTTAQLIYLAALIFNMPFQYCTFRYFLVLSGTPAGAKCSLRVFFSATENIGAFVKGAVIVFLITVLSSLGIFIGYFPVYLSFCMAPFYLALNPKIGVFEALSKSRTLMRGHKKETFLILLEFILVRIGAVVLSAVGFTLVSTIIELMALSLYYAILSVIFVRLDKTRRDTSEQ